MKRLFELLLISFFCFSCDHDLEEINHEYVDLGLSVKWATCNLGASKPEDYGNYYAWGETKHKKVYSAETYKWCVDSKDGYQCTKYCINSEDGNMDNKKVLDYEDDAACTTWGNNWRMPTAEEINELVNNCTWEWLSYNGTMCYKITSRKNGNYIFLPAAGYYPFDEKERIGLYGYYWTSMLCESLNDEAVFLLFNSEHSYCEDGGTFRFFGLPIRPVCP